MPIANYIYNTYYKQAMFEFLSCYFVRFFAYTGGIFLNFVVAFSATLFFAQVSAKGADVRFDYGKIIIEGAIEAGDFEKFVLQLKRLDNVTSIFIASPGGNVFDAIKIGRLIRELNLETEIPELISTSVYPSIDKKRVEKILNEAANRNGIRNSKNNYICVSACFLIFIAGIHRIKGDMEHFDHFPALGVGAIRLGC